MSNFSTPGPLSADEVRYVRLSRSKELQDVASWLLRKLLPNGDIEKLGRLRKEVFIGNPNGLYSPERDGREVIFDIEIYRVDPPTGFWTYSPGFTPVAGPTPARRPQASGLEYVSLAAHVRRTSLTDAEAWIRHGLGL